MSDSYLAAGLPQPDNSEIKEVNVWSREQCVQLFGC